MLEQYKTMVCIRCITYNHEKYLADALEGFVMQKTTFPFVAIVHDDASTDGTAAILRKYAEKYPDIIKPIYETENQYSKHDGSIGRVMDAEMAKYNPKYIAMCEGDDYWIDPYKLQKQVDFMEEHLDVGLCVTDFMSQNNRGAIYGPAFQKGLFKPQTFKEHLLNAGYIGPMTWLYRRDMREQFVMEKGLTDGTLALALNFFAISKVAYLPETTAVYRSHIGSATTQTDPKKHWKYEKGVFDTQVEYAEKYHCSNDVINRIKIQGYADFMFPALEADDEDFVKEALEYYRLQGMEMKWFAEKCKRYVRYHQQYEMISKSKAYKIGKLLLKPLKWLKK